MQFPICDPHYAILNMPSPRTALLHAFLNGRSSICAPPHALLSMYSSICSPQFTILNMCSSTCPPQPQYVSLLMPWLCAPLMSSKIFDLNMCPLHVLFNLGSSICDPRYTLFNGLSSIRAPQFVLPYMPASICVNQYVLLYMLSSSSAPQYVLLYMLSLPCALQYVLLYNPPLIQPPYIYSLLSACLSYQTCTRPFDSCSMIPCMRFVWVSSLSFPLRQSLILPTPSFSRPAPHLPLRPLPCRRLRRSLVRTEGHLRTDESSDPPTENAGARCRPLRSRIPTKANE